MPIRQSVFREEIEFAEQVRGILRSYERRRDTARPAERVRLLEELVAEIVLLGRAHARRVMDEDPPRQAC